MVSDFFGTLISDGPNDLEYLYSRRNYLRDLYEIYKDKEYFTFLINKSFEQLRLQLSQFLEEGNYLKIVTAMDSHDPADFIFNEFICRLYEFIKPYEKQVSVFLTNGAGNDISGISKVAKVYKKDGYYYAINKNNISAYIIDDKTEVFDFVKKEHNIGIDKLFAIGDSSRDIPMLFKCIDLGGQSSLISNSLYNQKGEIITTDSIIKATVGINYEIMIEKLACELYTNFNDMNALEQIEIIDQLEEKIDDAQWCYSEYNKLYTALSRDELDLNDLMKKKQIFDIIRNYNCLCGGVRFQNHNTIRMENIQNLSMYPTFKDYCNKVLVYGKDI